MNQPSPHKTNPAFFEEPFGLYIHWPFCVSKCPYCDFNSHVRDHIDDDLWRQCYLKELEALGEKTKGRRLTSVFFGGGTPSLMSPRTVESLLGRLSLYWSLDSDLEITLEANPQSADQERFRAFRSAGINRLSLGIQSFDEAALKSLGRAHNRSEALAALTCARQIFPRYSFDLIYARPHQTLQEWRVELREALDFVEGHLSVYQLTLEKGTAFYAQAAAGRLTLPETQQAIDFYELTQEILEKEGMPAYEISNHAQLGQECRHNLLYWRSQDYGALGPGGHGRLSHERRRWATQNFRLPERWIDAVRATGSGLERMEEVHPEESLTEFLMMGLRLTEGFSLERFTAVFGQSFESFFAQDTVSSLVTEGFLVQDALAVKLTPKGRLCLNSVLTHLLP